MRSQHTSVIAVQQSAAPRLRSPVVLRRQTAMVDLLVGTVEPDGGFIEKTTFVPGEQIAFSYSIYEFPSGRAVSWPNARISLKWGDYVLAQSQAPTGTTNIDLRSELALEFYWISSGLLAVAESRTLDYTLTPSNGEDSVTGSIDIQIVPEDISNHWIALSSGTPSAVAWNSNYDVSVTLNNRSQFLAFTFFPSLQETSTGTRS